MTIIRSCSHSIQQTMYATLSHHLNETDQHQSERNITCLSDTDSGIFSVDGMLTKPNGNPLTEIVSNSNDSPMNVFGSNDLNDLKTTPRRSSSGQKFVRFLNALTPGRSRIARRSRSFGDFNTTMKTNGSKSWKLADGTTKKMHSSNMIYKTSTSLNLGTNRSIDLISESSAITLTNSYASQLDLFVNDPKPDLYEFRSRWPSSFVSLITNYLGFLVFTSDDIDQIRDALIKEPKNGCTNSVDSSNKSDGSRTYFTPKKMMNRLKETKNQDSDLDHWFYVVNTILKYMLEEKRYKHRFIFRRPGNQSLVNELEKSLFSPRQKSSLYSKINHSHSAEPNSYHTALVAEITQLLDQHDPTVIACLLARILRRQGNGLIPIHLRRLFLQLVSGVKENDLHQRRAIRLLFLLCPQRLLYEIIYPTFELMARVSNESECEVDETSLAVLFSPIFFLDRATTTPVALANPLPVRVMEVFVRLARVELRSQMSVKRLFQVPVLFIHDCTRNLKAHQTSESPPLCCSLKYCVTMTPSPRSQCKKLSQSEVNLVPNMPRVNLTAAFVAKRPRAKSPNISKELSTPILKSALHGPTLDFRVRRTPNHNLRSQCPSVIQSPVTATYRTPINWS